MFQIKKILFPVDFSESCVGASRYVEAFTGRFQAELTLLHVVDTSGYKAWSIWGQPAIDMAQDRIQWAHQDMDQFQREELKYFDIKREVVEGDPATEIVAASRLWGSDLVMMPTHGLGVFRPYIVGSVTAKVLHDASCAVWSGVHLENAPPLEQIETRRVLCAVDLGPESEKALRWAAGIAQEHSAELIAAHVVPAAEAGPAKYFEHSFLSGVLDRARREVCALLDALHIPAQVIIGAGEPAKAVGQIAQSERANLLIIARGAAAEGLGRLRTQSYGMIRSSPCPVVSV